MDKCLQIFRDNIFDPAKRDNICSMLFDILKTGLINNQTRKLTVATIKEIAEKILQSLTVVMEFMDKGIKGLLSGDLTTYMIQSIENTLDKYHSRLFSESQELQELFDKKRKADQLYTLMLKYENPVNVQKSSFDNTTNFQESNHEVYLPLIGIDIPMYSNESIEAFKNSNEFGDIKSAKEKHEEVLADLRKEIDKKKESTNTIINDIYNEVVDTAFSIDKYRIPYYGIKFPDNENPINLFQRQLKIEELSFEMAHAKYKNTLESLIKIGRADQLAASHRIVLHWLKSIENAVQEQQRIFLRKSNLETEKGKPSYYLLMMPSEKIASICVMHLMKSLFRQFIKDLSDTHREQTQMLDTSADFRTENVKTPAITLFSELGKLYDKELKSHLTEMKRKTGITDKIEKHLMMEDEEVGSIPRNVQLKIGAFLTNIMCKNLKYSIGKKKHLLLKAQVLRQSNTKEVGYIIFNKNFIEHFISEIDKVHDLNIHIERSLPMIYKPAPWKNYTFGAYYLKQTKMAKIISNFREAHHLLNKSDISKICNVLNIISDVKWRVNKDVLEMIEYIWSIGGGLGEIPKRFNERPITAELLRKAKFKDKLKLIKEHQRNMETHALRCEFLLRLNIAQSFKNVN